MKKDLDTELNALEVAKNARLMAEALLAEKEALIAQLTRNNEELSAQIKSAEGLKQELHHLREIVNNVKDIVFIADQKGVFQYINPAAEQLLGFPMAELQGKHYSELIREDYVENIRKQYREQIKGRLLSSYMEFPVKSTRQSELWLGQRVSFVYRDDKLVETHSIARDITDEVLARKELITTYSRLKGLVENLHAGILVEDENRKIVLINQQFCDLFSLPVKAEVLIGADCAQSAEQGKHLFKEPEKFVQRIDELLRNRQLVLSEDLLLVDGTILERHYIPVFSGEEYLGHMWHYRDITVARAAGEQLRKSEEKYRGIMENMELGLVEVSSAAKIVRAYPRFCEMVGYKEEELIGQDPKDLFAPQDFKTKVIEEEKAFLKGKSTIWEAPLVTKNGGIIWALINTTPIYNETGALVGTLGIHMDITEQKHLQVDLEKARLEAEQAMNAEKAFLANMSHEIRNPLNSIVGMTNLMYDTDLSKEQLEYVNTLKYSADLLHALVSDVLDISKIEQGTMESRQEDFDFFAMANALCKTFEFRLSQRPIKFQCEVHPSVPQFLHSDSTFINQILINLLNNAFKFTEEGLIYCSAVSTIKDNQHWIEFIIRDTGIGIPQERLPFIFERFNQAGIANKSKYDGNGLGLPITKQLIGLLGGSINVQSTPGVGSIFTVLLPYEPGKPLKVGASTKNTLQINRTKDRLHVLIVEDNVMNQRYLENLMQKWGMSYTSAGDGQIALGILDKEQFDLILMDIRMPNLDGYETTLRLRNAPKNFNRSVPIIALTASALLDEKEKALKAGMNFHLAKPFTPEQLMNAFQQVFPDLAPIQPSIPVLSLNRNELAELYDGNMRYMREIFEIFIQTIPLELAQMRLLLDAREWNEFAAKAHKIKPSFQMVGLGQFTAHVESLEQAKAEFIEKDLLRDFSFFESNVMKGVKLVEAELNALV